MKRWICVLMVLCAIVNMMPFYGVAVDGTEEMLPKAHPFRFASEAEEEVESVCYYSDAYFRKDAREYDSQLATMSLCFELTTWARAVEADGWTTDTAGAGDTAWKNAYDLMDRLGFSGFAINEAWAQEPTTDSIGAVAAHKDLDGTTLIALGIRGGGYGQEWASNFTLGPSGEHQGFAEARDQVLRFLEGYLLDNEIRGGVKLWIVGYSRAGCVANMVAGKLGDGLVPAQGVTIAQEDLFAYTFEAPQGAMAEDADRGDRSNIHNIININDLVPLVAPDSWGFARYSSDHLLPNAMTNGDFDSLRQTLLGHFQTIAGETAYLVRETGVRHDLTLEDGSLSVRESLVPVSVLMEEMVDLLADDLIGDRQTYHQVFQDSFRQLMAALNGGGLEVDVSTGTILEAITAQDLVQTVAPMVAPGYGSLQQRKQAVRQELDRLVERVLDQVGLGMLTDVEDALSELLWNLLEAVLEDLYMGRVDTLEALMDAVALIGDSGTLQSHYPEVTLAWMMAQDSNYGASQADAARSSYRVLRVEGAADLEVYRDGTLVAGIGQTVQTGSIHAYEEDGVKTVILPSDTTYQIRVVATQEGEISYAVHEYDMERKEDARVVRYSHVAVSAGDVLTADVAALPEALWGADLGDGSEVDYQLIGADGRPVSEGPEEAPGFDLPTLVKAWLDRVRETFTMEKKLYKQDLMMVLAMK